MGDTWGRFGLSFYIYALLFVAFDIEIIFIALWALVFRDLLLGGFLSMLLFVAHPAARAGLRLAQGGPDVEVNARHRGGPGEAPRTRGRRRRSRADRAGCADVVEAARARRPRPSWSPTRCGSPRTPPPTAVAVRPTITHLAELELQDKGDNGRWGALDVIPTRRTTCSTTCA